VDLSDPEHRADQHSMRLRAEFSAPVGPDDPRSIRAANWFSRHGVLVAALCHLMDDGWNVQWAGDAIRRESWHPFQLNVAGQPIHDAEAERDGTQLLLEAVGHPGGPDIEPYADDLDHPEHLEQRNSAAFARYSSALFTGPELQKTYPDAIVVQAFPAHGLYRTYVPRAFSLGIQGRVELWMIQPDGSALRGT